MILRPIPPLRWFTSPFGTVLAALPVLLALVLGSCQREQPTAPGMASLQVEVSFPDGGPNRAAAARGLNLDLIRASAFQVITADSMILRARESAPLSPEDTRFTLVLRVPPGEIYRILVEAAGVRTGEQAATEHGSLFAGSARVSDLRAGTRTPARIQLAEIVPVMLSPQITPAVSYRIRWSRIPEARNYRLKRSNPDGQPQEFAVAGQDTVIDLPPGLKRPAPGQKAVTAASEEVWRVRAEFPDSLFRLVSAYSESVVVAMPGPVPPAAVTDLEITQVLASSVSLAWTAPGDDGHLGRAKDYDLRYATFPLSEESWDAARRALTSPPAQAATREIFTVAGLEEGTLYYFALKTADEVPLWSALSNVVSGTTETTPPQAPTGLQARAESPSAIALSWADHATNEDRYEIERRGPGEPEFRLLVTLEGSFSDTVRYRDLGLHERSAYRYRVRASNRGGTSGYSNEAAAITRMAPPRDLRITRTTPDSLYISWSFAQPDPDGFHIERRDPTGDYAVVALPGAPVRAYGDGGLRPLATYTYRVRAVQRGDSSAYSNEAIGSTLDRPPSCAISPPILDFGLVTAGASADSAFTLTNTGGGNLSGSVSEDCADFEILSGAGPFDLSAGQFWTVRVRFQPSQLGQQTCSVQTGTPLCALALCRGTGEPTPACSVFPDSLDFGTVIVGEHDDREFTIKNDGGGILSGDVSAACGGFSIVAGAGVYALAAGETRPVTIRFAPEAPGAVSCAVQPGTPLCAEVPCSGAGELPPACSVDPPSISFGAVPVDTFMDADFTITNAGGGVLSGAVQASCSRFRILSGDGPYSLSAGEVQPVVVRYTPTDLGEHLCVVSTGSACPLLLCQGRAFGWWDGFGPQAQGMDSEVHALLPFGGGLVAGGFFATAGGVPASHIALWNGTSWGGLGAGLPVDGVVNSLTVYDGNLFAGGYFYTPSGQFYSVSRWDGVSWNPIPGSPEGEVHALIAYNGSLIAGGNFTSAGGAPTQYIAGWNGSSWSALETGFDAPVRALVLFNGDLIAGGNFQRAGQHTAPCVARWDGTHWTPLGPGLGVPGSGRLVQALLVHGSTLVAGGYFFESGTMPASCVAAWDGAAWDPLGAGLNGTVMALVTYNGSLVAGGYFDGSGATAVNNIARFSGASWLPFGSGLDGGDAGVGRALEVYGTGLYAGGDISAAGGKPSSYIARWED